MPRMGAGPMVSPMPLMSGPEYRPPGSPCEWPSPRSSCRRASSRPRLMLPVTRKDSDGAIVTAGRRRRGGAHGGSLGGLGVQSQGDKGGSRPGWRGWWGLGVAGGAGAAFAAGFSTAWAVWALGGSTGVCGGAAPANSSDQSSLVAADSTISGRPCLAKPNISTSISHTPAGRSGESVVAALIGGSGELFVAHHHRDGSTGNRLIRRPD